MLPSGDAPTRSKAAPSAADAPMMTRASPIHVLPLVLPAELTLPLWRTP